MLITIDFLEKILENQKRNKDYINSRLNYFSSEIMEMLEIADPGEVSMAMKRTFQTFDTLGIPLEQNCKKIYRSDGKNLVVDWKISALASYLIIINCKPTNVMVARAQLYFFLNEPFNKTS